MGKKIADNIKALFPDGVEAITITKNDYDRLYGELTYQNIILQKTNEDLQEMLLDKEDELDIYKEKVRKANKFIKENTVNFGKYKVMIQEEDELAKILSEVVRI